MMIVRWVMKTTIEISENLLEQARKVAQREKTTLRALVEEGLRSVVAHRKPGQRFRLRKASFKGKGLQDAVSEGSWERIRELIYEGRGT